MHYLLQPCLQQMMQVYILAYIMKQDLEELDRY